MKDVKKIGFLGFGKTNRALFDFLSERLSFTAVVRDERYELGNAPTGAELMLGERCFSPMGEDVMIVSPSVRRQRREVKRLLDTVSCVTSDAELFFEAKPKNVIAITGSDGKSTTSALVGSILSKDGRNAAVCGNFGAPMTPLLGRNGYFVTELSSFMLSYMKPHSMRAAITNITPNHLNWHADLDEYREAKRNILENASERVVNFDCAVSREFAGRSEFAVFSTDVPFESLRKAFYAEHYFTFEGGMLLRDGEPLISREEIPLVGRHNVKNALLAAALTDGIASKEATVGALSSFKGLKHRCELVGTVDGIRYYDSSIDSTPERTRATLSSFDTPVTVILGGRDKNLSYEPLGTALREKAYAAILIGENGQRLREFISAAAPEVRTFSADSMRDAVKAARGLEHDTVLSPGATSFDRYRSFEERGDDFTAAVRGLS